MELAKGYADMVLAPLSDRYPGMRHGFVIELKYVRRDATAEAEVPAKAADAVAQLRRYLADGRLARRYPDVVFTGLSLVFRGWELARAEEVTTASSAGSVNFPPTT